MKFCLSLLMISSVLLLVACGVIAPEIPAPVTITPASSAPLMQTSTQAITTTAPESETGVSEATVVTPAAEVTDWLAVEGKTADNLPYLGNPDAPVTMIDYSDFL